MAALVDPSALKAVNQVQAILKAGHMEVVVADLSGYFDSIPHAELMRSVSRRVIGAFYKTVQRDLSSPLPFRDVSGLPSSVPFALFSSLASSSLPSEDLASNLKMNDTSHLLSCR